MIVFLARGCACILGFFSLLNLAHRMWGSALDSNLWWLDLRFVPPVAQIAIMLLGTLGLLGFSLLCPKKRIWYIGFGLAIIPSFMGTILNCIQYYFLVHFGEINGPWISFSMMMGGLLLFIFSGMIVKFVLLSRKIPETAIKHKLFFWILIGSFGFLGIPVLQMLTFGKTDYRRSADAVVVFGAHTYSNGHPSMALENRVRTACELYHQGYVKILIFSGGPGDGPVHETEAMRTLALQLGVSPQDILLDREGLNTQATVKNTMVIFQEHHLHHILVVSDFSHLVRIKLAYGLVGKNVSTVPAAGWWSRSQILYQMFRETAALWVYYLRGFSG